MGGFAFGAGFYGQYRSGGSLAAEIANEPDVIIQVAAQPWIIAVPAQQTLVQVPAQPWIVTVTE